MSLPTHRLPFAGARNWHNLGARIPDLAFGSLEVRRNQGDFGDEDNELPDTDRMLAYLGASSPGHQRGVHVHKGRME